MKVRPKTVVYMVVGIGGLLLLYLSREVVAPFVVAGIFAYLLDPVVSFLAEKVRLPRGLAILVVYLAIISALVGIGIFLGGKLVAETREFAHDARVILGSWEREKLDLPRQLAPILYNLSTTLGSSISFSAQQIVRFFSGAVESLFSFFVFLFALFYFLKERQTILSSLLRVFPAEYRVEFDIVMRKISLVLGGYLRAQLFLVLFMGSVTYVALTLLQIKYGLLLAVIAGLAELVPMLGPTLAFVTIFLGTILGGGSAVLSVPFIYHPAIVGLVYTILNQVENILVVPQVTGRSVHLHAMVILAAVLVGGHLFGALGFLIAVPVVATAKVVLSHVLDLLNS